MLLHLASNRFDQNMYYKPGINGQGFPRPKHLSILAVWVK